MRLTIFLLLFSSTFSNAQGEGFDAKPVRAAIANAIAWLEKDMVIWRETNGCAACHHGPMYLWAGHLAQRQGYRINRQQLRDYTQWMISDETSRVFPKETPQRLTASTDAADRMTAAMMGHKNLSQPTLYLAHVLNALSADDPRADSGWSKVQQHWSAAQMEDGSFAGRNAWRPIFNTPQILTLFAVTALNDRRAMTSRDRAITQSLEPIFDQAQKFLDSQEPDTTHQGLILRLLGKKQPDSDQQTLMKKLAALQRADGGWSQTPERPSDAFATGQTLYALSRAGVPLSNMAVLKGLDFLAKSQAGDGTWPMTSRANPETGRPADDLSPITYAGAAWATIGMTIYVENGR